MTAGTTPGHPHDSDDDSGVVPLRDTRHVEIERIETEPMTDDQERAAIRALAALITYWQQQRPAPPAKDDAA
ncbi:hypothetical protein CcI156_18130 [Frankia sp. CcI156]|uniref:hypothetical protein n=1 Tax=Frankia TaxID=1854 RepID=UPI0003CFD5E7|nr:MULTISPECIES: hypothetical protein [Frankia]ETA00781.1 hypothetical protein CcI6DRAFT_03814 [Frankia sp. CcI6]KFB03318.1 hypothetical protein ALLO2DRAFT_03913 [Frankia sp. Allo2]OAA21307.1 hypothetical protein AAY23_107910 [Frankia casuarinae]OFB43836.1 hypothetical protein Manayef4_10505 [Frankia sp. CgIM4]OHV51752.1 hypothetical protein CgIS1_18055 [Frankia sp. CgIS1]